MRAGNQNGEGVRQADDSWKLPTSICGGAGRVLQAQILHMCYTQTERCLARCTCGCLSGEQEECERCLQHKVVRHCHAIAVGERERPTEGLPSYACCCQTYVSDGLALSHCPLPVDPPVSTPYLFTVDGSLRAEVPSSAKGGMQQNATWAATDGGSHQSAAAHGDG